MAMDVEDYASSFRPDIIDAVSAWCQGATFAKVLTLTDVFEVCTPAGTLHASQSNVLLFFPVFYFTSLHAFFFTSIPLQWAFLQPAIGEVWHSLDAEWHMQVSMCTMCIQCCMPPHSA